MKVLMTDSWPGFLRRDLRIQRTKHSSSFHSLGFRGEGVTEKKQTH